MNILTWFRKYSRSLGQYPGNILEYPEITRRIMPISAQYSSINVQYRLSFL
jgi:hypothetical protein